jgi:polyhydroxybutyrate depolymerase
VAAVALLLAACGGSETPSANGPDNATAPTDANGQAGDDTAGPPATSAGTPVPSPGCGTTGVTSVESERREVEVTDPETGESRWYRFSTPPDHDGTTPVPLVVAFHGLSEGAEVHAGHSNLTPFGNDNGFAVAYPQGTGTPVRWNVLPTEDAVELEADNDLSYVDAMLDQLADELCIDLTAVYATGLSNGAGMASLMACERPDRFAAVAPVAGLRPPLSCEDSVTTPVLAFHGTVDPILLYNGGIGDLAALLGGTELPPPPPAEIDGSGYPASARAWATHNGCSDDPQETTIGDDIVHWVFDCPDGNDVEFYVVVDGGHTWPGSEFSASIERIAGPTTFTISANEIMWDFFTGHRLAAA